MIYDSITELIGHTPLLRLHRLADAEGLPVPPLAKLESFNPAGSIKDRVGLGMIDDAERRGLLQPGSVIIEPTSGNTGVGLALVSVVRGYRLILTMPDTMSRERQALLRAYGADIVLTPGNEGMAGAVAKAEELHRTLPGSFIPSQFENPANPSSHVTTANELWADTDGKIDVLVAGIGTGGTLCGTARRLRELNPALYVVGVEPASSPLLTKGVAGAHRLQGIGANFVPANYDPSLVDTVIAVSDDDAIATARHLASAEGVLTGFSGGAALYAAMQVIRERRCVCPAVIVPDGSDRYLSTGIYDQ